MKSICVKNLRSLRDTNDMEIKPINILVGSNSSGKSTFLRLFPLIKQSISKKINGPILWAGDDDYVDFGSFKEAINNSISDKEIKFKFNFDIDISIGDFFRNKRLEFKSDKKNCNVEVEYSVSKRKNDNIDYISELRLNFLNYDILLKFSEDKDIKKININDNEYSISKNKDNNELPFLNDLFFLFDYNFFEISLSNLREVALNEIKKITDEEEVKKSNNKNNTSQPEEDINLNIGIKSIYEMNLRNEIEYYFFKNILGLEIKDKKENRSQVDNDNIFTSIDKITYDFKFSELVMMFMTPYI